MMMTANDDAPKHGPRARTIRKAGSYSQLFAYPNNVAATTAERLQGLCLWLRRKEGKILLALPVAPKLRSEMEGDL